MGPAKPPLKFIVTLKDGRKREVTGYPMLGDEWVQFGNPPYCIFPASEILEIFSKQN